MAKMPTPKLAQVEATLRQTMSLRLTNSSAVSPLGHDATTGARDAFTPLFSPACRALERREISRSQAKPATPRRGRTTASGPSSQQLPRGVANVDSGGSQLGKSWPPQIARGPVGKVGPGAVTHLPRWADPLAIPINPLREARCGVERGPSPHAISTSCF